MRPLDDDRIDRWLAAEASAPDLAAELALAALFAGLPRGTPPAGFADRVLARAGLAPAAATTPARRWLLRVAALLLALLVGPAVALVTPVLLPVAGALRALDLGAGVSLVAAVLARLGTSLADGARFWELLAAVARPVRELASSGEGLALVAACVVLSVLSFRLLYQIDLADRSSVHASV